MHTTDFAEILKYTLPGLLVMATAYYTIKSLFAQENQRRAAEQKSGLSKASLPVTMQAYERLVLLLERMDPPGLILRCNQPGMDARQLQAALLQNVRDESDHNLSQQLYISGKAWEMVRNAREETISLINRSAEMVPPDSAADDLVKQVLQLSLAQENTACHLAMDFLKAEARQSFL